MEESTIISLTSLGIAALTLLTSFILGLDKRKIRELERKNKSYSNKLRTSLRAIKGYQLIETDHALSNDLHLPSYRGDVRKKHSVYFDSEFVSPGNIEELLQRFD